MAKYTLNTNIDDFNFVLIGIICPENQYRLISEINNTLKINLYLSDYLPLNLKDGKLFKFSLYHFIDEALGIDYYLIPNSSNFSDSVNNTLGVKDLFDAFDVDERVKLIRELPKTDYFILLKGEDVNNYQFKIIDCLKAIPEIIQVQTIEPNDLPSKHNLIF